MVVGADMNIYNNKFKTHQNDKKINIPEQNVTLKQLGSPKTSPTYHQHHSRNLNRGHTDTGEESNGTEVGQCPALNPQCSIQRQNSRSVIAN